MISDERGKLLDTGGGMVKALPLLGDAPFFLVNSDRSGSTACSRIWNGWRRLSIPARMDALLLLAPATTSIGYSGRGDFAMSAGRPAARRAEREVVPFVYAGAAICSPALFKDAPQGRVLADQLFDRAAEAGPAARAAPRRHLDACRHARRGDRRRKTAILRQARA